MDKAPRRRNRPERRDLISPGLGILCPMRVNAYLLGSVREASKSHTEEAAFFGIVSDQASENFARGLVRKLTAKSDLWGAERAKSGHLRIDSAADALDPIADRERRAS